ncbi:hypothetical protein GGS20DRAFT_264889 [Poronia punctata]|nr:hypothetical protein GGS20DRAFT_264889 [Poronia punctata]
MPQDPNLYGQRPAKKQKREIPLPSSLAFASELSSLISAPSSATSSSAAQRARPSKTKTTTTTKDDIFSSIKTRRKDDEIKNRNKNKVKLKHVHNTEEEKQDFARARRKMEEKARLYAAMKRGDYVAKENEAAPLVDFDRKWAERHDARVGDSGGEVSSSSSSEEEEEEEDGYGYGSGDGMMEYKDEFGRTRTGTRAEVQRMQRRAARSALGARELEDMAAVPTAEPSKLIYGDAIQTEAFNPESATLDAMAALAAKRDREPTPPPDTHFDGSAEIRTKGTGFYQFSREEAERVREMEALAAERENTERVRREREKEKERRRKEIEERRRKIGARRAEKLADNFLEGLAGEMGVVSASTSNIADNTSKAGEASKAEEESSRKSSDGT